MQDVWFKCPYDPAVPRDGMQIALHRYFRETVTGC